MNGGPNTEEAITVACIIDCPTIMVHAGKCYKALIDSGTAIILIRYSTYQHNDNSFKTPIQPTTAKLNTANGAPMTALGITALHLRIADFKFTHYLHGTKKRNCYMQRYGKFLTYTQNCEQKATNGIVKCRLKYCQDTMVLYKLKSQNKQLRTIWLISSLIKIQQKEGTQI